jgi:hypothetical protein
VTCEDECSEEFIAAGVVGAVGLAHAAAAATTARAVTVVRTMRRAENDMMASWCGMLRDGSMNRVPNDRPEIVTTKDQNGSWRGHGERSPGHYGMRHRFVIGVS